jgi:HSP20 family protein
MKKEGNAMTMLRMIPRRDLHGFQGDVERLLSGESAGWLPAVDVHEDEAGYTVQMDLPGFKPEDVKVRAFDGTLTIEGERKDTVPVDEKTAVRLRERLSGSFSRSFRLRSPVDPAGIKATYAHGVLEIRVPRAETAKPREIAIDIAS